MLTCSRGFLTWRGANEAARQVSPWELLLQDGNNFLIKILHGHGGDVPQLLQDLMGSLGRSSGVNITKNAVNLIYHLKKAKKTCYKGIKDKDGQHSDPDED